ncbi:MAG: hypothetical protein DSY76_09430 [Bacteroidetes bacterium]|nr:MAG: hypothetical protein DSY76_09430 [Bacteroidota bacterium]
MTEEVTFDKNGSGTYSLNVDMGQMMSMMKGMDKGKENDSLKVDKKPEKKDTIISVADILEKNKDSLKNLSKEEKEALYALKDAKIHIDLDEAKGKMLMQYIIPFNNVNDLSNVNDKLKKLNSLNKKKKNNIDDLEKSMPDAKVQYTFNKHKFRRIVTPAAKPKEKDSVKKDDAKMQQMLGMFKYKLVYHFPYRIKSVSYKDALLTADGKTLIIDMPMDKLVENPKLLDFEVKFE